MAKRFTVQADIVARDRASGEVEKARGSFAGLGSVLDRIPKLATAATAALIGLGRAFVSGAREALEYQRNLNLLDNALDRIPGSAKGVREELLQQASALAAITGESDTTILSIQRLISQMGVLPGDVSLATQAAIDLSAAFGISLEQAARNLARTTGGLTGELGELIPELRKIDTEGLKAGEGIRFIAEKYQGAAEDARTFGTALKELGNALSDFARNATSGAVNFEGFTDAVDATSQTIRALTPSFIEAGKAQGEWVQFLRDGELTLEKALAALILYNREQGATVQSTNELVIQFQQLVRSGLSMREAWDSLNRAQLTNIQFNERSAQSLASVEAVFARLGVSLDQNLSKKLQESEGNLILLDRALRDGTISAASYERGVAALNDEQAKLRSEIGSTTNAVREQSSVLRQNEFALGIESRGLDRNTDKTIRNTRARQANLAVARQQASTSISTGVTLSGGTFATVLRPVPWVLPDGQVIFSVDRPQFITG